MNRDDWLDLGQHIMARWPHQAPSMESLAAWFEDVADLDAQQVRVAISAYAREGREWPPTGGMLRKRVFELSVDAPTFGDAWTTVIKAVGKFGRDRRREAFDWLGEQHALYPALARQIGWRDICNSEEPDVIRGQARRIFDALVEQTTRDLTLRGLPDSGLHTLERVNSPEYRELVAETMRQMPQLGRAE
jgi:hypothetical protein